MPITSVNNVRPESVGRVKLVLVAAASCRSPKHSLTLRFSYSSAHLGSLMFLTVASVSRATSNARGRHHEVVEISGLVLGCASVPIVLQHHGVHSERRIRA